MSKTTAPKTAAAPAKSTKSAAKADAPEGAGVATLAPAASKADPKLATAWKTKSGAELTDAEVLAMPDSEYMNAKQLAHFRKMLEALKKELSEDIDRTVHTMQDEATVFADPNDRASQETDMAIELRNRDRERKLIKKIDETLTRINEEDYGYCDKCGVEIGIKRLEARPTATLCIDCKTLDELKEKQMAK